MRYLASPYRSFNGGRVLLFLLLFLLAIYNFITAGFSAFAIVCILPILALIVCITFHSPMFIFWTLVIANFFIMWHHDFSIPIPISVINELLEIILLVMAIINIQDSKFNRTINLMFLMLIIWCGFCTIEALNDTCDLGINIGAWYMGTRLMAFQLLYAFLVFTIYISTPERVTKYLYVWGSLALFAAFWIWKQRYIGMTSAEERWLYGPGRVTHVIQGGTLIRYFSIYSDAANYGVGTASTAVAFIIFGITSKIKRFKFFFYIVGIACAWAMFPTGTRTAIVCFIAGLMAYVFLSKSFKIAIPFTIIFGLIISLLAFTTIGNSNSQIRRMRSAFDKNDASSQTRKTNQEAIKKYMREAPWGLGIGLYNVSVPANNKYMKVVNTPSDSEYVSIWVRTGAIGITTFLICTAIIILGACWIVFFRLRSPSLRGIGAGLTCAMISQQLGGYGNMVLMQFPNCLIFYGGLTIVYILPHIEKEWIEWENKQLALTEENKRLKQEKREKSRVKTWLTWK